MSSSGNPPPTSEETGNLLAEFRTGSTQHKAILICLPFPVAFFIGFWVYAVLHWPAAVGFAHWGFISFTAIFLGIGGVCLAGWIVSLAALRWRLLLFEKGLLFCKTSSSRWVSWRDIAKYHEIQVVLNGVSTGHRLYLHPRRGKKIAIEGIFKDAPAVAESIKSCLIPALTREAEECLAKDQAVDFKFLELRQDGLKTPKDFVTWKDLESVAVEDNKGLYYHVVVRVLGQKKPWLSVPVTAFPNLEVFLRLLDKMPGR